MSKVIQDNDHVKQEQYFGKLKNTTEEFSELNCWESWWKCKNGVLVYLEDRFAPVFERGILISTDGVLQDNTHRHQAEADLNIALKKAEESDRLKSAFLANMSHEIRTPMNSILGFSELLKEHDLSSTEQKNYIKIIGESGERMLHTINSLIEISRLEAGETHVSLSEVVVSEALEFIFILFKQEAETKKLVFSCNSLFLDL